MSFPMLVLNARDAGRMGALHMRCFSDPWSAVSFRGLLLDSSIVSLGIEMGGELAAFVQAQTVAGEADILTIATGPEFRRRGLGTMLIRGLISRLGERGISRLTLEVAEDNGAARALYEAVGFTEDGRRPRYYTSGRELPADAVLMSMDLGLSQM
ncbi:MAG: ribosomal protein S18-alanine N-acetyltransferase [Hyphomonas sp.]|nr:ribosomal protein S18-alanine N-acetyltransferase [Hyphomonas sp.]